MLLASSLTANATLRYTTDGSRPSPDSPVMPAAGIPVLYPGPDMAVNVRGFLDGMAPSITNTMIVERSMYRPRNSYLSGVWSSIDTITLERVVGCSGRLGLGHELAGRRCAVGDSPDHNRPQGGSARDCGRLPPGFGGERGGTKRLSWVFICVAKRGGGNVAEGRASAGCVCGR